MIPAPALIISRKFETFWGSLHTFVTTIHSLNPVSYTCHIRSDYLNDYIKTIKIRLGAKQNYNNVLRIINEPVLIF